MAGATQRPRLSNTECTIGWICAKRPEHVAARCFLDEKHEGTDSRLPGDLNSYTLGRCRVQNVFAVLPPFGEYGTSSATAVAKNLLHSFPNVRAGLMVGIVAMRRVGSMMSGSETSCRGPGTVVCFMMKLEASIDNIQVAVNVAEYKNALEWLTQLDYAGDHNYQRSKRRPGTGEWFLKSPKFPSLA